MKVDLDGVENLGILVKQDPVFFTEDILGKKLWSTQAKILRSVCTNPRTAVRSCHGIGKTYTAALTILWYLFSHERAIVLSTAPTWRQVEKLIWKEIRSAYREAVFPLGGDLMPKSPELHITQDEWYAAGLSTNEPSRFQGFHEEYILVVVDEAAGVNPLIFEAIEGVLTSAGARLLLIGNPTGIGGPFYDAFARPGYNAIHVSAFDTPNFTTFGITPEDITSGEWESKITGALPFPRLITPAWVADRYRAWGPDSVPYQVRVMGNFPTQGDDTLIPLLWIELAMERWEETEPGEPVEIGVDVAAYGTDKTVIAVRRGQRIERLEVYSKKSTTETAGLTKRAADGYDTRALKVDEIGIGRGVVDTLQDDGFEDVGVNVSDRSNDPERFFNLRSELWWNLRDRLDPDTAQNPDPIALPPDDELLAELAAVKYKLTGRGQVQIESKEDMKKRLGRSPDRADAVVLALAPYDRGGFALSGGSTISSGLFEKNGNGGGFSWR